MKFAATPCCVMHGTFSMTSFAGYTQNLKIMCNKILSTRPDRLTTWDLEVLRNNAVLRDAYNRRWNVAFW